MNSPSCTTKIHTALIDYINKGQALLTSKQAALALGLSMQTLRNWHSTGKFPYDVIPIKIGNKLYWDVADLSEAIKRKKLESQAKFNFKTNLI